MNAPHRPPHRDTVSAVIPAHNDADRIARAVTAALAVSDEVIVVDGGSDDDTVSLARRAGARVLTVPMARVAQLDHGARAAQGDVLLLLDVDGALSPDARLGLCAALADPAVIAGRFRVELDPDSARGPLFSWFVRHACALGLGNATAAMFVRRDAYARVGGLRSGARLPRHDLLRRLARWGRTTHLAEHPVRLRARQLTRTPLRTLALWATLRALDALGLAARAT